MATLCYGQPLPPPPILQGQGRAPSGWSCPNRQRRTAVGTFTKTDEEPVQASPMRFTAVAGYAGAFTAATSAAIAVLPQIIELEVGDNIKVALIALVGAGVIAWAVASAGDALGRAYLTAHMEQKTPSAPKPLQQVAAAAAPQDDQSAVVVALPVPLQVCAVGSDVGQKAVAAKVVDGDMHYYVASPRGRFSWVPAEGLVLSSEPVLPSPPSVVALPTPLSVAVGTKEKKAIAVKVDGSSSATEFFVGQSGERFTWVKGEGVEAK